MVFQTALLPQRMPDRKDHALAYLDGLARGVMDGLHPLIAVHLTIGEQAQDEHRSDVFFRNSIQGADPDSFRSARSATRQPGFYSQDKNPCYLDSHVVNCTAVAPL